MERLSVALRYGDFVAGAGPVSNAFFGGNYLFDRDKTGAEGTFDEKAATLDLGLIRYPGGTLAERYFDLTDPDQRLISGVHGGDVTPLSDFLGYVNGGAAEAALVLPTIRYMDALRGGTMTESDVRAEIGGFLGDLKAGAWGDAGKLAIFEIGNEFYDTAVNPDGDAAEYGALARLYAEEIRAAFGADVKIAAQAGRDAADNAAILDAFADAPDLVDTAILHDYAWTLDEARDGFAAKSAIAADWTEGGPAESLYFSEWGVSNQRYDASGALIGADRIEDGMARAVATLDIAGRYIAAGVDYAAVWPIQQNTRGDLTGDEGETAATDPDKLSDNGLTLVGEAFRLMSESLPGMTALNMTAGYDLDGAAESARFSDELLLRAYENADSVVVFAASWDLDAAARLTLDLGDGISGYELVSLNALDGIDTDPNADPVLGVEAGVVSGGALSLDFSGGYEIQRLTLDKVSAAGAVTKIQGGKGDDTLSGGSGAEKVTGRRGDDTISADGGNDKVRGGGGKDTVDGNTGDDTLKGGAGDDYLDGGDGFDFIAGGGGDDTMMGGAGDDTLKGGRGADMAMGGDGADLFVIGARDGRLTILDFESGVDRLDFGDADTMTDLRIVNTTTGLMIDSGRASVIMPNMEWADMSVDDFIF